RPIIIHYHFFKNAGTSVDAILQRNFGAGWTSREYPARSTPNAAREFLVANPQIAALSSHTLPLPPPDIPDAEILPILFIRHPLDRLKSSSATSGLTPKARDWRGSTISPAICGRVLPCRAT